MKAFATRCFAVLLLFTLALFAILAPRPARADNPWNYSFNDPRVSMGNPGAGMPVWRDAGWFTQAGWGFGSTYATYKMGTTSTSQLNDIWIEVWCQYYDCVNGVSVQHGDPVQIGEVYRDITQAAYLTNDGVWYEVPSAMDPFQTFLAYGDLQSAIASHDPQAGTGGSAGYAATFWLHEVGTVWPPGDPGSQVPWQKYAQFPVMPPGVAACIAGGGGIGE